jgi:hypothetical protein
MTTQDLINTLKQGKPMTDRLMREIVRELEEKTEQLHTMGTALRAKDADHVALRDAVKRLTKADDDLLTLWDQMANNKPLEDEYHASRADLDRLLEGK